MNLPRKLLGSTDLQVSIVGLGTVKLGRNTDVKYKNIFELPSDKQAADLLTLAQDLGVNILDTSPAYGKSEERLGKLLKGQRKDWIIVGKAGEEYVNQKSIYDFTPQAILNSIKRSLKNLNTDYIDLLLIHSDGNDEEIINKYGVFDTLNQAKQQGLIRYSGMSTKTVAGGLLTLKNSDVAMVTYNLSHIEELPVIEYAAQHNKGILIKKALGSGHLDMPSAMKFIWRQPGISSIILGTINLEHLKKNVSMSIEAYNSN